jgi:hypothetical protein
LYSLIAFSIIAVFSCASGADSPSGGASPSGRASGFTGSGGAGMSLTIYPPSGKGLSEDENHLHDMVRTVVVADFSDYSAIEVTDWQTLTELLAKHESVIYGENSDVLKAGEISPTDYYLSGTIIKTSSAGYTLTFQVLDKKSDGSIKASYSGNCSTEDLYNFSGIHKASAKLLTDMGVTLSAEARAKLAEASSAQQVGAQTALAQGITAQRQGRPEIEALIYYNAASTLDPSLLEAAGRLNVATANIISAPTMTGEIAQDVQNEIAQYRADQQWKRKWIAQLTETEQYLNTYFNTQAPSFALFYSTELKRGEINFQNETVPLSFDVNLHSNFTWFVSVEKALQAVYGGLNATGRKQDWGLSGWPGRSITSPNPFTGGRKDFTVVFELVNERQQVIGRQSLTLGNRWSFSADGKRVGVDYTKNNFQTVTFNAVKADNITKSMTIRVAGVNGVPPQTALQAGSLRIMALDSRDWALNKTNASSYYYSRGVLNGMERPEGALDYLELPAAIWGDPVMTIGDNAFRDNGLTRIVIPNSVTAIGNGAFSHNSLTSVVIPNGVTAINDAFSNNRLTSVVIPNSVTAIGNAFSPNSITAIGDGAFSYNQLTSVVIPNGVTAIGNDAFSYNLLTSVVIPNSVTSIGRGAFRKNRFKILTIPDSVRSIGHGAFYDCWAKQISIFHIPIDNFYLSIGEGVEVGIEAFDREKPFDYVVSPLSNLFATTSFKEYYTKNGKKAGTYRPPLSKDADVFYIVEEAYGFTGVGQLTNGWKFTRR